MTKINLSDLNVAQLEELEAQIKAKKAAAEETARAQKETYVSLKDETIKEAFISLLGVSQLLLSAKTKTFADFETLIGMKNELFRANKDRMSDTFTTGDGKITISLGSRVNEGWADEVEDGIQRVRDYMKTLAKDEASAELVQMVMQLLVKDKKGSLRANNVLKLEQIAQKSKSTEFVEAIRIIRDSYRPVPSCRYIEVSYLDENNVRRNLPLSMSAFDIV